MIMAAFMMGRNENYDKTADRVDPSIHGTVYICLMIMFDTRVLLDASSSNHGHFYVIITV